MVDKLEFDQVARDESTKCYKLELAQMAIIMEGLLAVGVIGGIVVLFELNFNVAKEINQIKTKADDKKKIIKPNRRTGLKTILIMHLSELKIIYICIVE